MSTDNGDSVIDITVLLEQVDGDLELLDELAGTFVSAVPGWIAELRTAVQQGDAQTTFRSAHGVAGAAGAIQAVAVQREARALEAMGRAATMEGAVDAIDRLEARLLDVAEALREPPWRSAR